MRPAHNGRGTGADMAAERRLITYEDREQIEAGLNRGDRLAMSKAVFIAAIFLESRPACWMDLHTISPQ